MQTLTQPLVITAVIVVVSGCSRGGPSETSWKGRNVICTKAPGQIPLVVNIDGMQIHLPFSGRSPTRVQDDRDGWIRLDDGEREGWAEKSQFVLERDAPAYFSQRVHEDPSDSWAIFQRGVILLEELPDTALEYFTETIRLDPTNSWAYFARGNAWYNKGDYDRAIRDYDEAIRLNPRNSRIFYARGLAWYYRKENDRAITDLDEAIRLDPKFTDAFRDRGYVWHAKNELERALRDYDDAIRLAPDDADSFLKRGIIRRKKKHYDRALQDFDHAILLDPRLVDAFLNRGGIRHLQKDYDLAIADYDTALRLNPNDSDAFCFRAYTWYAKKEYNRAIEDLTEAIRLEPRNARALSGRALAFYSKLDYVRAIDDYDAAIQVGSQSAYSVIQGYFAARRANDADAARRFLNDLTLELRETEWPFPVIRFLRGEINEAALLALATDNMRQTEARCYLGLDHLIHGRLSEAIRQFQWVKEHGLATLAEHAIATIELERLERRLAAEAPVQMP